MIKQLTEEEILAMSEEEIDNLLFSYRDEWTTVTACLSVIENCDRIRQVLNKSGTELPMLLDATVYEAQLRGKSLLGMGKL